MIYYFYYFIYALVAIPGFAELLISVIVATIAIIFFSVKYTTLK